MARCLSPWVKDSIPLPCGKCVSCKKRRASNWSFRLLKEAEVSISAFFLTLTYDTDHVPITQKGFMTLEKSHLPNFIKRLRNPHYATQKEKLKYYAVGEYGTNTYRPHYHMVIYNLDLQHLLPPKEVKAIERGLHTLDGKTHYKTELWPCGTLTIGILTPASAAYTLKYISKDAIIPMHRNDDRLKEFSLMSKGLGSSYLSPSIMQWHREDILGRMYCNLKGGMKIAMPRYYQQRIYSVFEKEDIAAYLEYQEQKRLSTLSVKQKLDELTKTDLIRLEKQRAFDRAKNSSLTSSEQI